MVDHGLGAIFAPGFFGSSSVQLAIAVGGVVALVLFGISWLAQAATSLAVLFHNTGLEHACTVIGLLVPTGGLWRGAAFALEPVLLAAMSGTSEGANPITVPSPPTPAFLIWTACWLAVVLSIGVWAFAKRDV